MKLIEKQISALKTEVREGKPKAWEKLAVDHFYKLLQDLLNVAMYEMTDELMESLRRRNGYNFCTDDYITHYDEDKLMRIEMMLEDTQKGIDYITGLIWIEKRKRGYTWTVNEDLK